MSTPTDHEVCEQESAWLRAEVESLQAQLAAATQQATDRTNERDAWSRDAGVYICQRDIALADLAAVRTDLSVARGCLQRIRDGWVPFYGTWTQRTGSNDPPIEPMSAAEQNEMSGLTATPPVAQLDP